MDLIPPPAALPPFLSRPPDTYLVNTLSAPIDRHLQLLGKYATELLLHRGFWRHYFHTKGKGLITVLNSPWDLQLVLN